MKVYVDKLPKNCFECPCFRDDIDFPCGLSDGTKDYFLDEIDGGVCPLKSLAKHDKQVRKEMGEAIVSLEKENESLKNELIKECQEHREAMQIADKRIKAYQNELELYKRAFNVAIMDLGLCRSHYQTLNYELMERTENLSNTILERIKEKMEE